MNKHEYIQGKIFAKLYNKKFNTDFILSNRQTKQTDSIDVILESVLQRQEKMYLQLQTGDQEVLHQLLKEHKPVSRWTEDKKSIKQRLLNHIEKKNKKILLRFREYNPCINRTRLR